MKAMKNPNSFVYVAEKEAKEKEALERKKWEEGKRKRYEERMQRKAKREGKSLDYYIKFSLFRSFAFGLQII